MRLDLFSREFLSSLVVFLVALPLCMGIAVAAGVPPAMGLVAGIIGGIVVGTLSGAPLQVSGPAAGLVVLVVDIVAEYGLGGLAAAVVIAGLLQIVAGRLGLGQWFRAIAPAVIYAMLAGIGILIAASQFHVMVDDAPNANGVTNLLTIPFAIEKALIPIEGAPQHQLAALVGVVTLVALVAWNFIRERLPGVLSSIPAPLVAVGVGTALANGMRMGIAYVDVPSEVSGFFRPIGLDDLGVLASPAFWGAALALGIVASAESLPCANATDKLHDGPRSKLDQELTAQGVGNMMSGVIGGLPITGVIVRSTANVQAGATTRWSAVMHGIWLALAVFALPSLLGSVPVASLAAVLVFIGYKLVDRKVILQLARRGWAELAIYVVTVVAIVATDLLTGLMFGLVLSLVKIAWTFSRLQQRWRFAHLDVEVVPREDDATVIDVHLRGAATFLQLPRLLRELQSIDDGAEVHIHVRELEHIDHACLEAIADWERQRESRGGELKMEWSELESRYPVPSAAA